MIESLILIEGKNLKTDALSISLMNAKQLVIGNALGFGIILHVAATTPEDLSNALLDFAKVSGVSSVSTLMLRNT